MKSYKGLFSRIRRTRDWIICCGALFCFSIGCRQSSTSFIPEANAARHAVEEVLSAWQEGKAAVANGVITGSSVKLMDSQWQAGKKLAKYEITSELPADEGPRRFQVRLTFAGEKRDVDTVYLVVGKNPDFFVFRDKDYEMSSTHM